MTDIDLDLSEFKIRLINPEIHVSTKEAYSGVIPQEPESSVEEIIQLPVNQWKEKLRNDFEDSVFAKYSQLEKIKEDLYHQGSIYSSMSGSGSVLFGIFK